MSGTQVPHRLRTRRRRLVVVGLVVVGLGAALVATLQVEPLRAALWHAVGQPCGEVSLPPDPRSPLIGASPHDNRAAEACFAQYYAHCQPVSLTASQSRGIDTISTDTFVVEPSLVGPCGLADRSEYLADAGLIRSGRTVSCAGLTQEPDGLLVHGCGGPGGDMLLPLDG
jgi:hypothetical protein